MKQTWMGMVVCAMMVCVFGRTEGAQTTTVVDSLFEAALSSVGQVSIEESIKAFEQVIRTDRQYAPAYAELARLYMAQDSPDGRKRAERTIREALRLAPEHSEYQLILGDVFWAQGFRYNAERQYLKVYGADSTSAQAAYWIGKRSVDEFMKYKDMLAVAAEFAQQSRERAIYFLGRCMDIDPAFKDAYFQLGLSYLENNEPRQMVRVARQLLQAFPEDWDALLFCGLGYQTMGRNWDAHAFYTEAFSRIPHRERTILESVDYVISGEDQGRLSQVAVHQTARDTSQAWTDTPELRRFWQRQNPLFLTEFNERRMEHHRRVAYANLRYGHPSKGIPGWRTDMGKTYIKFGHPLRTYSQRPEMEGFSLIPHIQTWVYEDFLMRFRNWDGLDEWRWEGWDVEEALAYHRAGRYPASPREIFEKQPVRYIDPYSSQKYTMPNQVVAFREQDSIRLEMAYALPISKLKIEDEKARMDIGVFLFDGEWEEKYKDILSSFLPISSRDPEGVADQSAGAEDRYLIGQHMLRVLPASYHIAVEAGDRQGGSIGTFRTHRVLSSQDTSLAISDLFMASKIEVLTPFPETRGDLRIIPNPLHTYRRSQSAFLYLEVYNLTRDSFGRTRFDIAYRLGIPDEKDIDFTRFVAQDVHEGEHVLIPRVDQDSGILYDVVYKSFDRNRIAQTTPRIQRTGNRMETTVSAEYEGNQADDFTFLEIDIHQLPAGIYALTVTVSDRHTGQSVDQNLLFRVVE